jgi:hypothetical protein
MRVCSGWLLCMQAGNTAECDKETAGSAAHRAVRQVFWPPAFRPALNAAGSCDAAVSGSAGCQHKVATHLDRAGPTNLQQLAGGRLSKAVAGRDKGGAREKARVGEDLSGHRDGTARTPHLQGRPCQCSAGTCKYTCSSHGKETAGNAMHQAAQRPPLKARALL